MRHLWTWLARWRGPRKPRASSAIPSPGKPTPPVHFHPTVETLEERTLLSGGVIGTGNGLLGQYFTTPNLSPLAYTRTDPTVNLDSTRFPTPAPGVAGQNFSVRWTGQLQAQFSEIYTFSAYSDNGIRLLINGQPIINDWTAHLPRWDYASLALSAGQKYSIEVDFFHTSGSYVAELYWSSPSTVKKLIPTQQLYSGSATASSTPSDWFSQNLYDQSLQSLARSLDADHQLSRSDMLALFQEAAQDGDVTATELADLRTIVANPAVLGISAAVDNLANKVVNDNPANQYYQGQPLGDLTAGATGAVLQKLVNKWFLGLDHPTAAAGLTYISATGTLFNGSPSYLDVRQGYVSDCYFLAALSAVAERDPAALSDMITDNGDGTYTVRFFNNGVADYVTVDRMLPVTTGGNFYYAGMGNWGSNPNCRLWPELLEKAYAQLSAEGWAHGTGAGNAYASLAFGWEGNVITQITGLSSVAQSLINNSGTHNALVNAVQAGQMIELDSNATTATGIVPDHVYVALNYNAATDTFTCYNPWGYVQQLSWAQVAGNFSFWTQTA